MYNDSYKLHSQLWAEFDKGRIELLEEGLGVNIDCFQRVVETDLFGISEDLSGG
jgi:hypothetical protein